MMSPKLDILFLKPGNQKMLYGKLTDLDLTAIEPPMWGGLLAAHMRQKGYSVELLDAEVQEWTHEEAARQIAERKPLLAVLSVSGTNPSASTMNMAGAGNIARFLREISPEIKILFHGLHPSALPERTLREEVTDFICKGEGFYTLPDLMDTLKSGKCDFANVRGLWYRDADTIMSGPSAPVFTDLDALAMPAWDLLPMRKYRAHNWHCFKDLSARQPYGVLMTSLGCPYNCTFCCINAIFGKPGIRFRSPSKVVEDIAFLVENYGIRNIKIMDELFAVNERRVVEICDLIIERGYDLNMWAYARVNTVTPLMLEKMRKAGIEWVAYGFEAANKRVLKGVSKRYETESIGKVVQETRAAGLYIGANFIFGLPDDDMESMNETLQMAKDINGEWANFYATMAYPGSALYDEAIAGNWTLPESWQGYSQYSYETLPLSTKHLTASEVLHFRDQAFNDYFSSPRYQQSILNLFGASALQSVQEMLKHRLQRKH
jgi:Fe-S oxidoreductase